MGSGLKSHWDGTSSSVFLQKRENKRSYPSPSGSQITKTYDILGQITKQTDKPVNQAESTINYTHDIVAGEKLTVASRGVTLVAAFIPIASGKSLRVTYDVAKIKSTKSLKTLNKKFGVKIPSKLLDEGASGAGKTLNAEELKKIGTLGDNSSIRHVKGTEIDARNLFDNQVIKSTVKEVQSGVFVGQGADGFTYTFRAVSKSGPPTIDVNGISGLRKIKFLP